ncbi:hypothetical protein LPB140_02950 [Sphingorhabdus lutea]|uniref:Gamma-glutamylcyclotransferase AIG2-like domain-containing protein n=1 Tax=Sphingorhabdus lutea TaxID=1913578 RepID=A0A1L3J9Y9_9SPHN|nr:gamma-glutamylcyclotransferase family protein [Sphingorhabdus lutea]APG61956.1 hypothetical protein LPB140_02950 [Sphingorhabdus lutea]
MNDKPTEALFSYGTLQQDNVQMAQFGRLLSGQKDVLTGYKLGEVKITDPDVVAKSGLDVHHILYASSASCDRVEGTLFWISEEELKSADEYEVDDYIRRRVTLTSGQQAWVYIGVYTGVNIGADAPQMEQ